MAKSKMTNYLQPLSHGTAASGALLFLRLVVGVAFLYHGFGKIQSPMSWMPPEAPVPGVLQFLAAISEFGGGIALIAGLLTPIAMLGLSCTMGVAVMMHMMVMKDPFVNPKGSSYELALVYLAISILFMILGPGSYSMDMKIFGKRK